MMSNWDDEIFSCPICKTDKCVLPSGPSNSPVLIIANYPGEDEIRLGRPMCGPSGGVLREELARNGIDVKQIRICNMWFHEPNKNEDCFQDGVQRAIAEAKDRKFILLIGAETVKFFCKKSVEKYNGLMIQSDYLSAPCMASVQPTVVFKGGGIGGFRLTMYKFSERIKDLL